MNIDRWTWYIITNIRFTQLHNPYARILSVDACPEERETFWTPAGRVYGGKPKVTPIPRREAQIERQNVECSVEIAERSLATPYIQ